VSSFYSQFGEDRYLVEHKLVPKRGTFVDVGAGDPVRFSNSLYFEQHGWTGVCVDADPKQVESLRGSRSCIVEWAAITSAGRPVELLQCEEPDYSTMLTHLPAVAAAKGWSFTPTRVPGARLEAILERHAVEQIDILSIDTEGTELDVCDSMDWQRHRPSIVVIEHATMGRPKQETAVREYFAQLPYRLIHRTECNLIFARTRLPRLLRRRLTLRT
jgi:FkbM family methyltransferase